MKKSLILFSAAMLFGACQADNQAVYNDDQTTSVETIEASISETGFNANLAKELGADPYGMRQYVFATLLTGPNDALITDEAERAKLFEGHFSNMSRLAEEGKLVLAGPFMEAPPKRGLFIFNVTTIEEAEALVQSDPSIAAGIFKVEFAKYYGSAALMQINDVHKTIQEKDM